MSQMLMVRLGEFLIETLDIPALTPNLPPIVILHEGLGSVSMWRDFPQKVAQVTGCRVVAWSRPGYGASTPYVTPRQPDYMHREALEILPGMLAALNIQHPIIVGHSDGGSIALIHAGAFPEVPAGVIVMAPHEFVEAITLQGIAAAREIWQNSDWPQKLARHHADAPRVFSDWADCWLSPPFKDWNIEASLGTIRCPVLAIQGEDDEYATMRQIEVIAEQVSGTQLLKLAACGHSPHRDQPQAVLAAIQSFIARLPS